MFYDAHSIRSRVPRLFEGELPQFNIGTNDGTSCDDALSCTVETLCAHSGNSHIRNGRFKGGWTTRHYGRPQDGVHAIQMELAMRGYMAEPAQPGPDNWPTMIDPEPAIAPVLRTILNACIDFTKGRS